MEFYNPYTYRQPDPFCVSRIQGNILFQFIIHNTNIPSPYHYTQSTIHETCKRFTSLVTGSQDYINFIENAAINGDTMSIIGVEDFSPQIVYNRHDFYASDNYTLKPHANKPLQIRMNITHFALFKREVELAHMSGGAKPQRSVMPTQEELLEFLTKGE